MADEDESTHSTTSAVSPAPSPAQEPPTNEPEEEGERDEDEEEEEPSGPPEMPTLNTASLSNLAAALGPDGLKLAMCLNVPTTALITIQLQGLETGWVLDSIISNMLFYWKLMRRTAKDRDKVNEMTRALRHVDLNELADAVDQSYQEGIELTNLPTKYSVEDADDNPETE